jgi:fused signal recognition particle receptor
MDFKAINVVINQYAKKISEQFGSGDPFIDFIVVCTSIALLLLIILIIFPKRPYAEVYPDEREEIEKVHKHIEGIKHEISHLKEDVHNLKKVATSLIHTTSDLEESVVSSKNLPQTRNESLEKNIPGEAYIDAAQQSSPTEYTEKQPVKVQLGALTSEGIYTHDESNTSESIIRSGKYSSPSLLNIRKLGTSFLSKIKSFLGDGKKISKENLEELEAILISADMGVNTTQSLIQKVTSKLQAGESLGFEDLIKLFKEEVFQILTKKGSHQPAIVPAAQQDGPLVVMVVGVNGVGKTTTVAKLANNWKKTGAKVVIAAADTFRAAAVNQLKEWGKRIDIPVIAGPDNGKPAAVVFDAQKAAYDTNADVLVIDTAGRLHNKSNLMQELEGIRNVLRKSQPHAPHETILVLDGTVGQNALSQAREFNLTVPLTGVIVTKLDGTPKGGIVVAIKEDLGIPVRYIGLGEKAEDLRVFNAREFTEALFDV